MGLTDMGTGRAVKLWCAISLAGALGFLLATGIASAGTVTVTNTSDSGPGSLRQAIIDAAPGDTIVVPAGTYTLTSGELAIAKSLTISGGGAASTLIGNGASSRVFHTSGAGNTVAISGVTIQLGDPIPISTLAKGGGVLDEAATLTLSDDVVANNQADADGAGASGTGGQAEGGGVFNEGGTLFVRDTKIVSNRASAIGAPGQAGGIATGGGIDGRGTQTIEGVTFADNTADSTGGAGGLGGISDGGGLAIFANGPTTLAASTFSGNLADASAGAGGTIGGISDGGGADMLSNAPAMSATNVTFTGNVARSTNGGIASAGGLAFGSNSPVITLTNATLSANTATGTPGFNKGGDASLGGSNTHVENTVVSAGVGDAGFQNCGGTPTSLGHNLDSLNQCNFTAAGDQVNTDPLLGALLDNGGPAQTLALEAGSPAIDAATASGCPATDERGVLRPAGVACDIGAFEVATPAATTGVASSITPNAAVLKGTAFNPDLAAASSHFEYGTTSAYGSNTSAQLVAGTSPNAPVSISIAGLAPHTLLHFRLVVSNAVSTAFGVDQTFTTGSTKPSPPSPRVPRISRLKLVPPVLIAASRGGTIASRRTGTTVSYTDTSPATTTFTVERPAQGRAAGRSCVRPTKRNRGHKRCTRWLKVNHFTHSDKAGQNRFHFTGRLSGRKLQPGQYRLEAVPRNSAGAGTAVDAGFSVKKR
jgi:hypothetical protein